MLYLHPQSGTRIAKKHRGRVAQLVQSTWFTPKGSGVRIPSRPQNGNPMIYHRVFLFVNILTSFFVMGRGIISKTEIALIYLLFSIYVFKIHF